MVRWLLAFVLLLGLAAGGAYIVAGREKAPRLTIEKPERLVGQAGTLEVTAEAPTRTSSGARKSTRASSRS